MLRMADTEASPEGSNGCLACCAMLALLNRNELCLSGCCIWSWIVTLTVDCDKIPGNDISRGLAMCLQVQLVAMVANACV